MFIVKNYYVDVFMTNYLMLNCDFVQVVLGFPISCDIKIIQKYLM